MAKKLYVGNLNYKVTNASLESLFAEYGAVRSAQVVMDRETGGSKGFGFVEMADDQAAQAAICREMQRVSFETVPYIPTGVFYQPTAYRKSLRDVPRGFPQFYGVRRL